MNIELEVEKQRLLLKDFPLNPNYPDGSDEKNPIRIYSDGVFDCFHYGHARLFQKIKKMFKHVHLIIGVCLDSDIIQSKGMPIMNDQERRESVTHCKWVDEVVEGPWVITEEYLDKIGAHYIAHDPEPYKYKNIDDLYGVFKEKKRFIATTRTDGISTTDIINKVVSNHEEYIERALKKHTNINSLNLESFSYIKYKSIDVLSKISSFINEKANYVYEKDNSNKLVKEYLDSL